MAIQFIEPVAIVDDTGPAADSTWATADATGLVPASATGLILRIKSGGVSGHYGIAMTNSTLSERILMRYAGGNYIAFIGLDGSQQFLCYRNTINGMQADIVGYFEGEVYFAPDPLVSTAADNTWTTTDISSIVQVGDTPMAALVSFSLDDTADATISAGWRPVGDATDISDNCDNGMCAVIPVDVNNQFEIYHVNSGAGLEGGRILGYIKDTANLTIPSGFPPPSYDLEPSTVGVWEQTTTVPSAARGIFLLGAKSGLGGWDLGIRKPGSSDTFTDSGGALVTMASGADASGQVEVYTGRTGDGYHVMAYTTAAASPPTLENNIADQTATVDQVWNYTTPSNTFSDDDPSGVTMSVTVDGGAAPAWMTVTPNHTQMTVSFSGTPTTATSYSIEVTATDADGSASDTFTLTVNPAGSGGGGSTLFVIFG